MSVETTSGFVPMNFSVIDEQISITVNDSEVIQLQPFAARPPKSSEGPEVQIGRQIHLIREASKQLETPLHVEPEVRRSLPVLRTMEPCLQVDADMFGDAERYDEAIAICNSCLLMAQCAEQAIAEDRRANTVRGGLRPQQINYRRTLRKADKMQEAITIATDTEIV